MAPVVHHVAQTGFGTGTNELYDRARPSYQPHALAHIRSAVKTPAPLSILEIGAGTGIFTRALLASPEWRSDVGELKAVEPSEGMRDVFAQSIKEKHVTVAHGTFNETGVEDGWADLIIIAQAFHWCPDYNSAAAEFARALKPGGAVAFVWNLEDRDRARWVAQLRDRIEQHEEGTPQFRLGLWRQAFDTPNYQKLFAAPEENQWPYDLPATVDIVVDRASSKSYISILPDAEKAKVQADLREIVNKGEDKVWIDEAKGEFKYPYRTYVVVSRKK